MVFPDMEITLNSFTISLILTTCPIKKLDSAIPHEERDALVKKITEEVHDAIAFARKASFPRWEDCLT